MAMYVQVLEKGGCTAFGQCHWDGRARLVELDVTDGEAFDVTIEFPEAVSSIDYWEDGIDGSEPVISSASVTVQFQTLVSNGTYEIEATYSSGARRRVKFQANADQPFSNGTTTPTDDDDVDYGAFG